MKLTFFLLLFFVSAVKSQQLELQFPISHGGLSITNAMYSSDGKQLLTQQDTEKACLWDANTYKIIREFKGVNKSFFSNDGKLIVLIYPGKVSVLSLNELAIIFTKKIEENANILNAFLSNGNKNLCIIKSSGWPITTEITSTDISNGQQVFKLNLKTEFPVSTTNTSGSLIAISDFNGKEAAVYEAVNGSLAYVVDNDKNALSKLIFSPDDKWLAGISGKKIIIWNAQNGSFKIKLTGHQEDINDINFSYKGTQLVSASEDKTIIIWDFSTGRKIKSFQEEEKVKNVSFTKKDNYLLAGFEHFGMSVWDINKETRHKNLYTGMAQYRNKDQVSPDEKLIFASMYGGAKIHKLFNGQEIFEFEQYVDDINDFKLSHNKKLLLTINKSNGIHIWDMHSGKLISGFGIPDTMKYYTYIKDAVFSIDNKIIIAGYHNGDIGHWDVETGTYLGTYISRKFGEIRELIINNEQNRMLITATSGVSLYQLDTLKEIFSFSKVGMDIFNTKLNLSENQVIINTVGNSAFVLNAKNSELISKIEKNGNAGTINISDDGKKLTIITYNGIAYSYDPLTGKELTKYKTWPKSFNPKGAALSADGNQIYIPIGNEIFAEGNSIEVYNTATGKLLRSFSNEFFKKIIFLNKNFCIIATANDIEKRDLNDFSVIQKIAGQDFIADEKNGLLYVKNNYAVQVHRLDGFEKIISFAGLGKVEGSYFKSSGGVAVLPNMYYMGNKEAVSKLHFLNGLKPIAFEQLDVLYNRPDKVMEVLGTDSLIIKLARSAYFKRIKKLGLDSATLGTNYSVPLSDFKNRGSINAEQESNQLVLHIEASDSMVLLANYNVWVNEVPVFGSKGIELKDKKVKKLDTKVTVTLSDGANKIETSVTNVRGIESYKQSMHVFQGSKEAANKFSGFQAYEPGKKIDEYLYFIGIGINNFSDAKYNLNWSVKDIRDLCIKLKDKYKEAIVIDTLFNENVTISNIKALKQKLLQTSVNDKVIISYSGHGLLSKDYDYYLSTYSVNFNNPEENGLPYEELESLLDNIPARKKLMLIDACHSGEVDKEEFFAMNEMADSLGLFKPKGIILDETQSQHLGLKNSFELMQSLFVNVGKSTGATIISAAAGNQFALERGDLKNGVFTYSILEAMNKRPAMKISELKKIVGARVEQLTNGMQKPTSRNETIAVDWEIW